MNINVVQKCLLEQTEELEAKKQENNNFLLCDFIDVIQDEYFLRIEKDTEDKSILEEIESILGKLRKENNKVADRLSSLVLDHGIVMAKFMYNQGLKDGAKMYKLIS